MLRDEAVLEIKRATGFRLTQDATIIAALQQAQRELETGRTLPDALAKTASLSALAGLAYVSLPTDFLRLLDGMGPFYTSQVDESFVELPRLTAVESIEGYGLYSTATRPKVYSLSGTDSIFMRPFPSEDFTLFVPYYARAVALTSNVENVWLLKYPDLLISTAGIIAAEALRDKDAVAIFTRRRDVALRGFMGEVVEQELAGRPLIMGRHR